VSLPQHILFDVGGTIFYDAIERLPSAATVTCKTSTGATIFDAQTATVSTINTTLNPGAKAGDTTINVVANTGMLVNSEMWLRDPDESVRIKEIDGTSIRLYRPLFHKHNAGSAVEGTRVTYAVTAAQAAVAFFDGWLEWILTVGGSPVHRTDTVVCTKYPLSRVATAQDLYEEEPMIRTLLASGEDVERLLDLAFEDVIKKVAMSVSGLVFTYAGNEQFRQATIYAAMMRRYRRQPGVADSISENMIERYSRSLTNELQSVLTYLPRDEDSDEIFEDHEKKSISSARIYRG
jgi:hypothetical protein